MTDEIKKAEMRQALLDLFTETGDDDYRHAAKILDDTERRGRREEKDNRALMRVARMIVRGEFTKPYPAIQKVAREMEGHSHNAVVDRLRKKYSLCGATFEDFARNTDRLIEEVRQNELAKRKLIERAQDILAKNTD